MERFLARLSKWCCIILSVASILNLSFSLAQQEISEVKAMDQMVRVCLTRIGERERLDFVLSAPYQLSTPDGLSLALLTGSDISFQVKNDQIFLFYQNLIMKLGKQVTLFRSGEDLHSKTGLYLTNFPALYQGDLQLDLIEGKLRAVLTIHVEDYLLGVIPYEMGDSFPLEALKAQTIAARTYALSHQGRYEAYDLVDNTNDQAFRGYIEGSPLSEQAVLETRGICGYDQGMLAQCFYSASNGGKMELPENVWSERGAYKYYSDSEDPYDIANPESMVLRYDVMKHYDTNTQEPDELLALIAEQMNKDNMALVTDGLKLKSVNSLSISEGEISSGESTKQLHIEAKVEILKPLSFFDSSPEEVYLFENNVVEADAGMEKVDDKEQYIQTTQTISLQIPIFPLAETALSLSINSNYENEIWNVTEKYDRFTIEVRRYGHGVGMSQRGAQWMAAKYGKSYKDILSFYYPGMELVRFPEQKRSFKELPEVFKMTSGPAPTATPRPTLMPLTQTASNGEWYAVVTEIADDSSLNLRAAPGMNSNVLMRLYKGQRLLVMERCAEVGWLHVRTDSAEGYVMEKYLSEEN